MRLLRGLGPGPNLLEVDELAVVLRLVVAPDCLHRLDALAQAFPPSREVGAVIFHFLAVPAATDAEDHSSVRKRIEAGDLLGERNDVALDDQADAAADLDLLRRRGGERHRHEQVVVVVVVLRQVAAERIRSGAAHRDMRVVDEEDRLEPTLFRRTRHLVGTDREVVLEGDYAVIHGSLTSTRREPRRVGLVRTLRRPLRRPFAALAFCQPCIFVCAAAGCRLDFALGRDATRSNQPFTFGVSLGIA